jgi:hypothetical protein
MFHKLATLVVLQELENLLSFHYLLRGVDASLIVLNTPFTFISKNSIKIFINALINL